MRLDRMILITCLLIGSPAVAPADHHAAATADGGAFDLDDAVAGDWRSEADRARDSQRHPREALEFFGLAPGMTVVELSPGGGWYTKILAPYVNRTGGMFIAAGFDPNDEREYAQRGRRAFQENFVDRPETYGKIAVTVVGANSEGVAPDGSADLVLTFRNAHNWVPAGDAPKVFADAFRALRPGGVFGVVDHRLPEDREANPKLRSGYVHESVVVALAQQAGFVLEADSAVNRNAADTADHPFGVWTLKPSARTAAFGEPDDPAFDRAPFDAIGESDRFTLRFRKPQGS